MGVCRDMLAFFLVVHLLRTSTEASPQVSRFCEICRCVGDGTNDTNVTCTDNPNVVNYLFEESFWSDGIRGLAVQNVELNVLEDRFPESNLERLDLSYDNLATISVTNSVFANLQKLVELDLDHNDLTVLKGEMFRGVRIDSRDYPLSSLKVFRVSHNFLHTLDADLFEHIDGVEVLDLSHNPFRVLDTPTVSAITNLVYLKELYLENTELEELPRYFLHTPKFLKVLDLSANRFSGVPTPLEDTRSLETLVMNQNPIVNLTAENGFPVIPSLTTLYLCHIPQLVSIGGGALAGLEQLRELHASDNINLREIDPYALTRREDGAENEIWPPISVLELRNDKLAYLDRHLIVKWEGLDRLDLGDNPWSCDCDNQWLVDVLMPTYVAINETEAERLSCASPTEMVGKTLHELYAAGANMRCLDYYGNRPEKDAVVLVGILAGLLIGIPLLLFLAYAYRRRCFGLFDGSPAAYSRQFYSRTRSGDDVF